MIAVSHQTSEHSEEAAVHLVCLTNVGKAFDPTRNRLRFVKRLTSQFPAQNQRMASDDDSRSVHAGNPRPATTKKPGRFSPSISTRGRFSDL